MNKISHIAQELGSVYKTWKSAEKRKNELRDEFFSVATEELSQGISASMEEFVKAPSEKIAREIVSKRYARYEIKSARSVDDGFMFYLEERPEFRNYRFVNPIDGMIYQRSVVEGAPSLDDDRLKIENPALWEEISYIPEPQREMKPIEELTNEQIAAIQPYVYSGRLTVKLSAPRKAKPEELEDAGIT